MMRLPGIAALALAIALGTWVLGWMAVPVIALVFGAITARRMAPMEALVAVVAAWLALLGVQTVRGSTGEVARTIGGIVGVPTWVVPVATIVFGALLAWSSAVLGREIGALTRSVRARRAAPGGSSQRERSSSR